jgi:hypothetical protein
MHTTLYQKLALLTDEEAERCIEGLLEGLRIENDEYAKLLGSPADIEQLVQAAAGEAGTTTATISQSTPQQQSKAIRVLLTELAEHEKFGPELEAWIDGARMTMFEPVTTALVLTGIVLVLSTDVKIEYKKENGKRKFAFALKKSPTSEKILEKFFGLFR